MGLQNLYYYTWYPPGNSAVASDSPSSSVSRSPSSANCSSSPAPALNLTPSRSPDPEAHFHNSYWTWPIPGRKTICLMLILFVIVVLALILCVALSPSSSSNTGQDSTVEKLPMIDHDGEMDTTPEETQALVGGDPDKRSLTPEGKILESEDRNSRHGCKSENCLHTYQGCPAPEASFSCNPPGRNASKNCISSRLVCNGKVDCLDTGKDEETCIALSRDHSRLYLPQQSELSPKMTEGYIMVRINGIWHPYCSTDWSEDEFETICDLLGFSTVAEVRHVTLSQLNSARAEKREDFRPQLLRLSSNASNVVYVNEGSKWDHCNIVYLKCSQPLKDDSTEVVVSS